MSSSNSFAVLNDHELAYFLGLFMAKGKIVEKGSTINKRLLVDNEVEIPVHKNNNNVNMVNYFKHKFNDIFYTRIVGPNYLLRSKSVLLYNDLVEHFATTDEKELNIPKHVTKYNVASFLRGLFEQKGSINIETSTVTFNVPDKLVQKVLPLINVKFSLEDNTLTFNDCNSVDFLGILYSNLNIVYNHEYYDKYVSLLYNSNVSSVLKCKFMRTDPNAAIPSKERVSDEGFDITLITVYKTVNPNIIMFDTGIKINPPAGYHIELLPRSSLSKTGWMLSNSVGLIDSPYRGNLLVSLTKVVDNAVELPLPFRCVQAVLRKNTHYEWEEVDALTDTTRNTGSFGSTGGSINVPAKS